MALVSGTKFGPYVIQSLIGAGGMGEVYRARDTRLNRDVAIKVLPASYSEDPDRLQRFAQEAQAAAALNHPNILSIHDVGGIQGSPYVVSELLQGESLRDRLRHGPITTRKAIEYARQIVAGLAAAHEKGIVHRDLKPENLFLTADGRAKILDFGLAKITQPELQASDDEATVQVATEPGTVMGTAGYMSPEQVRGKPTDARSDIFSFGAILYEMLSGKRAFRGESSADTMSAILNEDPPDLSETNRNVPPALERIVRHCLEKNAGERFQSARDVDFNLEALTDISSPSRAGMRALPRPGLSRRWFWPAVVAVLVLASWIAIYRFVARRAGTQNPAFHEITFRNGTVWSARFAPDGQSIVYSAAWDGGSHQIFSTRFDSTDSRPMDLPSAVVLGVSSKGEMAIALHPTDLSPFSRSGTLARVPLAGGAPRELIEDVLWADWTPDGQNIAAIRAGALIGSVSGLEFPIGTVIYRPNGWVSHVRFSPDGESIAVADHIPTGDDGRVVILDLHGNRKISSSFYNSVEGLAWSPDGREIWFSAVPAGSSRAIYAMDRSGKERLIYRSPSWLTLQDISGSGLVLLTTDKIRVGIFAHVSGAAREQPLSWFDWSLVSDMSDDGKAILFSETGEAVGANYGIYLRKTDGSPAVRLGDGNGAKFSPDGRWVLGTVGSPSKLVLLPIGAGEVKQLGDAQLDVTDAMWMPDSKGVVYWGIESGGRGRAYYLDLEKKTVGQITPSGFFGSVLSADNRSVVVQDEERQCWMYPIAGGDPKKLNVTLQPNDYMLRSLDNGKSVLVRGTNVPTPIFRIDLATGRRELWKEIAPADPSGVQTIPTMAFSADGKSYAYSVTRTLSDLYVVEGLK